MNYKLGFLRTWVVVAILWCIAIGFIMQDRTRKYFSSENVGCSQQEDYDRLEKAADKQLAAAGLPTENLGEVKDERARARIEGILWEVWQRECTPSFNEYVAPTLILMFLPPLALYALGLAANWIIAGFRSK